MNGNGRKKMKSLHNSPFYVLQKKIKVCKMEWVNGLRESQRLKSGGRRFLRKYGISDDAEITQPFAEMGPETTTRLILNWLTLNAKDGYDVEIRIKVPEKQTVYKSKICMRQGTMFVRQTREAPELIGKALHHWDNQVNYRTLTYEEIIRSVQRADLANSLQEEGSILQELFCRRRDRARGRIPIIHTENINNPAALKKHKKSNETSLPMLR